MRVPQNGWFIEKLQLKRMIWGYPYFRKPPCGIMWKTLMVVGQNLNSSHIWDQHLPPIIEVAGPT